MQTNIVLVSLYSGSCNEKLMETIVGHYKSDFELKQKVSYTITDGVATITEFAPVIKATVSLPMPFVVPVNDLGSGQLVRIDINIDTLQPQVAICPTAAWATPRRSIQPQASIAMIMADYTGLA